MRKHVIIYSISEKDSKEILTKLSKKKVKFTKDNIIVDLTKEKVLADGNPIRVVFLRNISRRIGERTIVFENKKQPFFSFVFPVKLNKQHTIDL